jgi:hypothetical protein
MGLEDRERERQRERDRQTERQTFPFPHAENRRKTQNGGPHLLDLLVLYCRVGGIHMARGKGSGWLQ